ncbi:hypothetical protein M408DRAFT_333817 [Serendipita vermifera MAFF 305830]|uniref:Uncharacterized protein n=1 Tax=Serendipita vermifera MAFF 305830 TaxID=933852 RepID=A0A0C2W2S0_SERVB|nr:hypothetical protein M408DRAFT_333817 [Serendipita vermifera MAFF 305830]
MSIKPSAPYSLNVPTLPLSSPTPSCASRPDLLASPSAPRTAKECSAMTISCVEITITDSAPTRGVKPS